MANESRWLMAYYLAKVSLQSLSPCSQVDKAGGLTRQTGQSKDVSTLTANIFVAATNITNITKRVCAIEQHILDTSIAKQMSYAATDI